MFGFSAALGLWAFEFGQDIAGSGARREGELARLRVEVRHLREERDKAQCVANSAESLLKAEQAAQERLAQQTQTDRSRDTWR